MVSALDKKLLRDLWELKGQVATTALVVACGVASYVTLRSAYDSLLISRDEYYRTAGFADVFASVERAPAVLERRLVEIPGVAQIETRVVERVLVPLPGRERPASGTVVSYSGTDAVLNKLHFKQGRPPDPGRSEEVLLLDAFAQAHGLTLGDSLSAVINGNLRVLVIVGTVASPEYLLPLLPGQLTYNPADSAVIWMDSRVAQAAFGMESAFNDLSLRLEPGAEQAGVIDAIDKLLAPFGAFGAIPRAKQASHFNLQGELQQLDAMASFVPFLFLSVAALLVNIVLSRLVQLQRAQIASLKAIGYPDGSIGWHYIKLVGAIVAVGALLGLVLGGLLGREFFQLYTDQFFKFPEPRYRFQPSVVLLATGISAASALAGALWAARKVARLPPAEAMRPSAPSRYGRSFTVGGWARWLGPSVKMVLREITRRPLRVLLSALGIALAVGILVVARYMVDAIDDLLERQFQRAMREDLHVSFVQPLPERVLGELGQVEGVLGVEGMRTLPVRFRHGHRFRDSAVIGYPAAGLLRQLLTSEGQRVTLPERGIVLTRKLGEVLGVSVGDTIQVEVRQGDWKTLSVPVVAQIEESFGLQGHMLKSELHRWLGEEPSVDSALLLLDAARREGVMKHISTLPRVLAVSSPGDIKRQFDEQSGQMMAVFTLIVSLFGCVIAIGVVYNNARVALSERTRELASLRVLGYTRAEISRIVFGEQVVQVLLALPLGLLVGQWFVTAMMSNADPETYRFPVFVSNRTRAFAVAVVLGASALSALLIRRRIDSLDLIAVLKTRE